MSPELIAIIAAAVSIGGLVTVQIRAVRADLAAQVAGVRTDLATQVAGVRTDLAAVNASVQALDGRVRAVENELAYLRGLLQGAGVGPIRQPQQPEPPAADEGAAA